MNYTFFILKKFLLEIYALFNYLKQGVRTCGAFYTIELKILMLSSLKIFTREREVQPESSEDGADYTVSHVLCLLSCDWMIRKRQDWQYTQSCPLNDELTIEWQR